MSATTFPWPAAAPSTWHGRRMRCLTLWRPWDQAILRGGKDVENRPGRWAIPAAGILVALHAGATWDEDGAELVARTWPGALELSGFSLPGGNRTWRPAFPRGAIVGLAWMGPPVEARALLDEHPTNPWAYGPWCYPLHEVLALEEPVRWKGAQGLVHLPDHLEDALLALWAPRPAPVDPGGLPLFQPRGTP